MAAKIAFSLVSVETRDGILVLSPQVENMRDGNHCLKIREPFLEIVRLHRVDKVLLARHRVRYMSSIGVRALVAILREVGEVQGQIMPTNPHGELRGLLFVCSLISDDPNQPGPFEIATSREDGLACLRSL